MGYSSLQNRSEDAFIVMHGNKKEGERKAVIAFVLIYILQDSILCAYSNTV